MRITPFGDSAVFVELDQRIDGQILASALAIADAWERAGMGEAAPAYASVLLRFDPLVVSPRAAADRAGSIARTGLRSAPVAAGRLIEIPTRYDGPDLASVAQASGLTPEGLVALHAGRDYTVFFLGFMPGFAYCGMVDPGIVAPRLGTPRSRVPAGAVAIADGQTAVYPFDSPGGWRLIGRTEIKVFDASGDPPALIAAGDRVRFVAIR